MSQSVLLEYNAFKDLLARLCLDGEGVWLECKAFKDLFVRRCLDGEDKLRELFLENKSS